MLRDELRPIEKHWITLFFDSWLYQSCSTSCIRSIFSFPILYFLFRRRSAWMFPDSLFFLWTCKTLCGRTRTRTVRRFSVRFLLWLSVCTFVSSAVDYDQSPGAVQLLCWKTIPSNSISNSGTLFNAFSAASTHFISVSWFRRYCSLPWTKSNIVMWRSLNG